MPSGPTLDAPVGASADGDPSNRDRTRNYLIWVIGKIALVPKEIWLTNAHLSRIGGYYPESHPILTSPNLLLNQFDQDDFWGLAELLGQVKPPVASKTDIDQSGLEIIKASQVTEYEKQGKVIENTSERVSRQNTGSRFDDPSVLTFYYSAQCLICLSDYEPDEDIRVMSCKHAFHQPCVDKWLEVGRNNCPACRSKVRATGSVLTFA
ncbi:hypothetical protein M407DRAFT_77559 [Tulasnella calospora MUT 4182]|uniref:RING-type domain-containing protein n=1 Tax=Tulasnella calospora MUT 4182 TaxID=1051891 RepID=A0A0C3QDX4_9AGAM|nr:hypothetical protein M407DRAFT_77559 [Tulasnella calospora MUT 4182]